MLLNSENIELDFLSIGLQSACDPWLNFKLSVAK